MKRTLVLLALLAALPAASSTYAPASQNWPLYGYDAARSNSGPADTGITAGNVGALVEQQVDVGGTVDSSPIYENGVFYVTTTYGKTVAIDGATGGIDWTFTPSSYGDLAGTYRITNASPAADPGGTAVYAASPDGVVRKLNTSDGSVAWATPITLDPTHEKITSSLNVANGLVYATTGGYDGDAPPYQGHVVVLDAATGAIRAVWNSLCADRHRLIDPATCDSSDSAIWSRNGATVGGSEIVVATGNGPWNGTTDFGDSVALLDAKTLKLDRFWTPANQQQLDDQDLDLGSTSPALLGNGWAVQGGKDATLKLLDLRGRGSTRLARTAIAQSLPLPGGQMMFSEPAVWNDNTVFVSTAGGTVAYRLVVHGSARPVPTQTARLAQLWANANAGTSPVVAGGLLYVAGFDGKLHVYVPATGTQVAALTTGDLHWQSPIVADGMVAMPEGDANAHQTDGVLDIFRLPS